jgi:hypothetical protein
MAAMSYTERPRVGAPNPVYWPVGVSVFLLVTGLVAVFLETTSLLFFVGVILIGGAVYGFLHRSPRIASSAVNPSRTADSDVREIVPSE